MPYLWGGIKMLWAFQSQMEEDLNIRDVNNKQKPIIFRALLYLIQILLYGHSCECRSGWYSKSSDKTFPRYAVLVQDIGRSLVEGEADWESMMYPFWIS